MGRETDMLLKCEPTTLYVMVLEVVDLQVWSTI